MGGLVGTAEMQKVVVAVAELANVVSKFLHGGGIFSMLGALGPVNELKAVNFVEVKKELMEMDAADRMAVENSFKGALALVNADVQAKVLTGVGEMDKIVDLAGRAIGLVNEGKNIVTEVKALLGV